MHGKREEKREDPGEKNDGLLEEKGEHTGLAKNTGCGYHCANRMSRIDQLTGRKANFGHSRSHSNIATKRRQNVNLQTVRIGGRKIRVSARTLKTLKKLAKQQHGELPTKKQKIRAKRAARAAKKSQ